MNCYALVRYIILTALQYDRRSLPPGIHAPIYSPPTTQSWSLWPNRASCRWQYMTSEIKLRKVLLLKSWSLVSLILEGSSCLLQIFKASPVERPTWGGTETSHQKPAQLATLELGPPVPTELSDNWMPAEILTATSQETQNQNQQQRRSQNSDPQFWGQLVLQQ